MTRRHLILARVPGSTTDFEAATIVDETVLRDPIRRTSLPHMLNAIFDVAGAADVTISTRAMDLVLPPLVEAGALIDHAPGASLFVIAPEGHGTDYAGVLWRTPTGSLTSAGRASRMVSKEIVPGLRRLIEAQGGVEDLRRRGHLEREFLIRRDWVAADLLPERFPPPSPIVPAPGAGEKWAAHRELERHRPRG